MSVVSLPLAIIGDGDTATQGRRWYQTGAGDAKLIHQQQPLPMGGGGLFSPRHSSRSSHIWSLSWEKGGRWLACSAKSSKGTKTKLVEETSEIWRAYHQHQQQKRDLFALWNGWEQGGGDGNDDFGNRHHSRATP